MTDALFSIPVKRIDGSDATLADYRGQVMLIVNVASKCGLTPQYEGLEKLHQAYVDRGFTVLGFPANDFAGQEPGNDAEILDFCTSAYGVRFPLFSKIVVTGEGKHPLYRHLTEAQGETEGRAAMEAMLRGYRIEPTSRPEVVWNFEKFLVDRQGRVVRRFAPDTVPEAPVLAQAIQQAL